MEAFLVALLLLAASVVVGVAAKNGAEREMRRREKRWARVPVAGVHRPWEGAAAGGAPLERAVSRTGSPGGASPASAAGGAPVTERPAAPSRRAPVQRTAPAARGTVVERPRPRPRPTAPQVNINEAGLEELRNLPGVGVRAAERIVAYREQFGPFESVQGLEAVEGFDAHRVGRLSPSATV